MRTAFFHVIILDAPNGGYVSYGADLIHYYEQFYPLQSLSGVFDTICPLSMSILPVESLHKIISMYWMKIRTIQIRCL